MAQHDPKKARIEIRVTHKQKEAFEEAAAMEGISLSEFVRREILADERSTPLTRKHVRDAEIVVEEGELETDNGHDPSEGYLASDT